MFYDSPLAMTRISVSQPRSFLAAYALLPFLLFSLVEAFPLAHMQALQIVLPGVLGGALILAIWVELVRGKGLVTIDTNSGLVEVHGVSVFFVPKKRTLPLARFASVVSYLVPNQSFGKNVLELVTVEGGQALRLASFPPGPGTMRSWVFPSPGESSEARQFRHLIASECGIRDGGFLGVRLVGAQI